MYIGLPKWTLLYIFLVLFSLSFLSVTKVTHLQTIWYIPAWFKFWYEYNYEIVHTFHGKVWTDYECLVVLIHG